MCSRKDYVAIAAIIKQQRIGRFEVDSGLDDVSRALADHFAADNPKFDRARFLKACGVAS